MELTFPPQTISMLSLSTVEELKNSTNSKAIILFSLPHLIHSDPISLLPTSYPIYSTIFSLQLHSAMKFTLASILSIASAAFLSLSSVQSVALPIVAEAPTLEKREIKGLNNYACKLTKAHPRPIILVHATPLTLDSWKDFVPLSLPLVIAHLP